MASAPAILLLAAFISLFAAGNGLHCYQCEANNPKCSDPFEPDDSTPLRKCVSEELVCGKHLVFDKESYTVNRDCIPKRAPIPILAGTLFRCKKDACNSAPQHFSPLMSIIPLAAAVYMAIKC